MSETTQTAESNEAKVDPYPEHSKVEAVKVQSQAIGEFIEWLHSQDIELCKMHEHGDACLDEDGHRVCGSNKGEYNPVYTNINDMLAEFFDVDLKKLDSEKEAMFQALRKANQKQEVDNGDPK